MNISSQPSRYSAASTTSSQLRPTRTTIPIRPARRRVTRNLLLDLPIAGRLTLGFLVAALIAGLAAGTVGILQSQSLSRQSDFYQHLLQLNTSLTTGRSFLQLMDSKVHQTLNDATVPNPSQETLTADRKAIQNLTVLYTDTLANYVQNDLLDQHADEIALLDEGGHGEQPSQQRSLANSAIRTWQLYNSAQQQELDYIFVTGNLQDAQTFEHAQAEPTNADALSALQALIQFDGSLANAVRDAANVEEQNQLFATLLATVLAILSIAVVGWLISETLVRRLRQLHRMTKTVEEGQLSNRIAVVGRDEIADVSSSVNAMLDTIVGLLQETRQQRDVLTNAAEHLFSDMRIASAGDLRVSATVSDDPIGLLANAFNFTVGRFRRFVLHTQSNIEQLDVISQQGFEHVNVFVANVRRQLREVGADAPLPSHDSSISRPSGNLRDIRKKPAPQHDPGNSSAHIEHVQHAHEHLLQGTREDIYQRLRSIMETLEQAFLSVRRLSELISARTGTRPGTPTGNLAQMQVHELLMLEKSLIKSGRGIQDVEKNVADGFNKLDMTLDQLTSAITQLSAPENLARNSAPGLSDVQAQEIARFALGYAQEINTLLRRLMRIIQEMRSVVTPFRLEGATDMSTAHQETAGDFM